MHSCSSRFALGTAQFGGAYGVSNELGGLTDAGVSAILAYASERGITTLDTAAAYGCSEERLGKLGGSAFQIVSKLPPQRDPSLAVRDWVVQSVDSSLKRLKVTSLYGLLLHRSSQLLEDGADSLYSAMRELKQMGKVAKIGVSIYEPSELDMIIPKYDLDLIQSPWNILDTRIQDSGWLDRLKIKGIEVHARSLFLQGLLLMPAEKRPSKFKRWSRLWNAWDEWLSSSGLTAMQACVGFATSASGFGRFVVGVDSAAQLEEILHAADSEKIEKPAALKTKDKELLNPALWASIT